MSIRRNLAVAAGIAGVVALAAAMGCSKTRVHRERETVTEHQITGPHGEIGAAPGEPILTPDREEIAPPPGGSSQSGQPAPQVHERTVIRHRDSKHKGVSVQEHQTVHEDDDDK